jgi:hypothetical protein
MPLRGSTYITAGNVAGHNVGWPARLLAATKALLAFGGMTQHCRRCGLRMFF